MGVLYQAISVLGFRFNRSKLYVTKQEKTFEHDFPEEHMYCPHTGRKLWQKTSEEIPQYRNEKLGKYPVYEDYETDYAYCALYIGKCGGHDHEREFFQIPEDLEMKKQEMMKFLLDIDFWDDSFGLFGLHTILYCSC